jgi:hypothetical protein
MFVYLADFPASVKRTWGFFSAGGQGWRREELAEKFFGTCELKQSFPTSGPIYWQVKFSGFFSRNLGPHLAQFPTVNQRGDSHFSKRFAR